MLIDHTANIMYIIFSFIFRGVLLQGKYQLNEAIQSFQRAIQFRPSLARKLYKNTQTSLQASTKI